MLSKLAELLESIPSEQRESPRRLTKLRKIDGINLHERESTDICKDDLLQLQARKKREGAKGGEETMVSTSFQNNCALLSTVLGGSRVLEVFQLSMHKMVDPSFLPMTIRHSRPWSHSSTRPARPLAGSSALSAPLTTRCETSPRPISWPAPGSASCLAAVRSFSVPCSRTTTCGSDLS